MSQADTSHQLTSTKVPLDNLKWVLEPSFTTEAQTFYITAHNGIFALFQLVYSSINSWSPSVQITARVYMPDGVKKIKSVSLAGSALELSADKLSATCSNMTITYKADASTVGPSYIVKLDVSPELLVEFNMDAVVEAYQINEGKAYFDPETPATGYVASRIMPKGKVSGMIVVDGIMHDAAGHGVFSHAIQCPPYNVARWNFINFQDETNALILYQFEMVPGAYPKDIVSQGVLVLNNEITAVTIDNHSEFQGTTLDAFSNYQIPNAIKHVWHGKTRDTGVPIEIEMRLKLDRLVDKIDVLSELPYLIRMFIQTFISAPFVYQWIEDTEVVVRVEGGKEIRLNGRAFHENTFLAELEQV
ncbi:hypothetical protein BATDEDRAFT_89507 [Batrachochytrium dendrobatidis JAM81]|uniref:Svf1-like C-terminal domain-containing protein n=2 Tax=Batrachochytrium dendrobatidis TaxID=109871 RepID=F4P5I3_BATDJ|nr:uncharacterized protein BATDEDRAFT_89507 [Batrachochytrium dendrobatidis JAM81]EGF79422.1 hypothetical protein BATDEDRAFT_89507 [Batrachochytrium dendrobatidis JAM81]KAJ8322686.1 putative cell survival pathways protein [Batrachochytrium dendrobatidis]KAK5666056.1 putative cell survival pathways protein [Batrachochytrium dendrobatidis]OAJ42938.1 hypothetical protein BDEG_26327 [Batrachochytrium dendrobatidis JEL423]|eukprot:XP_006680148.1 hypothetical protein BATDEDRAFT_89507 [Batrachochytrium dendrobatidis JAM81]